MPSAAESVAIAFVDLAGYSALTEVHGDEEAALLAAVEFVGRLCHATDTEPTFPIVRAGIHAGPAVRRGDDWYGATVNIAARAP